MANCPLSVAVSENHQGTARRSRNKKKGEGIAKRNKKTKHRTSNIERRTSKGAKGGIPAGANGDNEEKREGLRMGTGDAKGILRGRKKFCQ
jgi:hypothetical protein